jgi:hypothetical protein
VKRVLIGVALLVGGLLGLFMTACGGYVTVWGLRDRGGMLGMLFVAIPSLLIGVLLLRFVGRRFKAWQSSDIPAA